MIAMRARSPPASSVKRRRIPTALILSSAPPIGMIQPRSASVATRAGLTTADFLLARTCQPSSGLHHGSAIALPPSRWSRSRARRGSPDRRRDRPRAVLRREAQLGGDVRREHRQHRRQRQPRRPQLRERRQQRLGRPTSISTSRRRHRTRAGTRPHPSYTSAARPGTPARPGSGRIASAALQESSPPRTRSRRSARHDRWRA